MSIFSTGIGTYYGVKQSTAAMKATKNAGVNPKEFQQEWLKHSSCDAQENPNKTEIVVKPDGSRVLVVTMNIGGMVTSMSLEISKPTNQINDTENEGAEILVFQEEGVV